MTDPTPPPQIYDALLGHSMLIGSVTIYWNAAHETVFGLFHRLSGMPKPMAEAVFFSLKSDTAQRGITRSVCKTTVALPKEQRNEVIALLGRLDQRAGERNAAIHTMWELAALSEGKIFPSPEISAAAHNKNLQEDVEAQFKALLPEVMQIDLGLRKCLRIWEILQASPETPTPPPLDHMASNSAPNPQAPSASEESPPRSSRE